MCCMKFNLLMLTGLMSLCVNADQHIDFYGVEPDVGHLLVGKYSKRILKLEHSLLKLSAKDPGGKNTSQYLENLSKAKDQLELEIKQDGDFASVMLDTVFYAHPSLAYTTIEVITKDNLARLRFVSPLVKNNPQAPYKYQSELQSKNDVITQMSFFTDEVLRLFISGNLADIQDDKLYCPVYHCLASFDQPTLAPYLSLFNAAAIKDKVLILKALSRDPVIERRGFAVFLVGHFNDPREIIKVLIPYINDPCQLIRNNAMRVLSATLRKSKIKDIDPRPFLDLLDSPYDTDRNKSLHVLLALAESESMKNWLRIYGAKPLLANLALKQPNNHLVAYKILQRISGQSFSDLAVNEWRNWFLQLPRRSKEEQSWLLGTAAHRLWQSWLRRYHQFIT